ncbi:MTH865 family protein [Natrialbaceae archaeon A-gly3]
MADEAQLREQMVEAFDGADYPVSSPMDLVPALPNGPGTKFESGEFSMTVMELNAELEGGDFPYESVDAFVDDIIAELKADGHL